MSRCFPYPPPGYCRNGATHEALIESIKLQKETDKAKAERRKEKRAKKEKKEKKREEKEKRKNDEKLKSLKNQSQDSHKLLQKEAAFTDTQINGTKTNTEVVEKSDLTQEHGQPIKPCYSSDSTQNSNKRRRDDDNDDGLLPDDSTSHGKHIKIRLLKKHKGSDPSTSAEDARSKTVPLAPSSNLDRTHPVPINRNNNSVPATSGRENNAAQGFPLSQTKSNARCERTTDRNPNGFHAVREQPASSSSAKAILPSGSRKSDVEVLKSSRQQQQPQLQKQPQQQQQQSISYTRPVVPQSRLKHEIPSTTVVNNIGMQLQGPNLARHQQVPSTSKPGIPGQVINKPNQVTTGKRPINEITVPSNSGPTKLLKKEEPKKAGPTRAEKKMMKKHAKYEKLIGSWAPPAFQALLPEVVDDEKDWLSRSTKHTDAQISRGEVESCREVVTSLLQPRARFLAEADVYALPYSVPF